MSVVVTLKAHERRKISLTGLKVQLKEVARSLEDMPLEQKVDTLAHIRAVKHDCEGIEQRLCESIKEAKEGQRSPWVAGVEYKAKVIEVPQSRLDTATIRAIMSPKWIKKHTISSICTQVRVALKGVLDDLV